VRVEVNRNNEVRVYRRYLPYENAERRHDVLYIGDVWPLAQAMTAVRRALLDEQS
jgi:hypothetical protein